MLAAPTGNQHTPFIAHYQLYCCAYFLFKKYNIDVCLCMLAAPTGESTHPIHRFTYDPLASALPAEFAFASPSPHISQALTLWYERDDSWWYAVHEDNLCVCPLRRTSHRRLLYAMKVISSVMMHDGMLCMRKFVLMFLCAPEQQCLCVFLSAADLCLCVVGGGTNVCA